ncbi:RNA polymerase sigma-70 factor, ECF subfamily [Pseudomonas citronellolis]|uniref:RNA polymerase sigma-70 factor, ECF subfamily n=1 Tax=Pseudomonas citronellolis TaxID=53408 RepID=A0AAQ1KG13_9PSED|nr:sigma-70 family RNA polymerase sigma factor [Pseudomonas citronellolis]MDN6876554.1 sigma-70 family RNA polymerase sigma factor [Pseudomonas citronellolis]UUC50404.1 sigma-70 family RNA polymerase sigma factor [Pseudomonas citronellolis]SFD01447.1 RNA polymerase sigma-70 factor, ECF subfamily [Pseudomonas citronellolis]
MTPVSGTYSSKLECFFSDHHRWLLLHVQRYLGNRADSEDTAAETFCQLLAARVDPQGIQQPRAYLSTIARRLVYDRHRRRRLEQAYLDYLAGQPEALEPSPEERALLLEALSLVDRSLSGLPQEVKQAFLYSQLDGLGYAEIGHRLGVSERTVGRYMKQALRQIYLNELVP